MGEWRMVRGALGRIVLSVALLLAMSSCVYQKNQTLWTPFDFGPPGQLALSNFRFEHAAIEAVVSAAPDCSPIPGAAPVDFDLPFKGTRVIEAAPDADVCWRWGTAPGQWGEWNRAFTASGRALNAQL